MEEVKKMPGIMGQSKRDVSVKSIIYCVESYIIFCFVFTLIRSARHSKDMLKIITLQLFRTRSTTIMPSGKWTSFGASRANRL
jgi:hypothetical protein